MKTGKTLIELASELTRINETKRDFIVPISKMSMNDQGAIGFVNGTNHSFGLNNHSSGQLATFTDIPKQYFDRIQTENKSLLAQNVNHGLSKLANSQNNSRMIRTLDGNVRAFLSSRYRCLDSFDLLSSVLPTILDNQFEVVSSEITEKRMYLKATTKRIQTEVNKGDVVQYGVTLSTSDVGAGSLRVEPFVYRLVCLNGMIMNTSLRKYHVGKNQGENEVAELLSDKTKELDDAAFFSKVRDILLGTMRPEIFEREVSKLRTASENKIENVANLDQVVELSMNKVGIKSEFLKNIILNQLATGNEGAGLTQWGLANSFTRAAQNTEINYDLATDLERAGGEIVELSPSDWKRVAGI